MTEARKGKLVSARRIRIRTSSCERGWLLRLATPASCQFGRTVLGTQRQRVEPLEPRTFKPDSVSLGKVIFLRCASRSLLPATVRRKRIKRLSPRSALLDLVWWTDSIDSIGFSKCSSVWLSVHAISTMSVASMASAGLKMIWVVCRDPDTAP